MTATPPTPAPDLLVQDLAHDAAMVLTAFLNDALPLHVRRSVAGKIDAGAEVELRVRPGVPMRLAVWLVAGDQAVELGRLDSGDLQ